MIEYLKYRIGISKLFKQRDKLHASFSEDIRKAHDGKKPEADIELIKADAMFEEQMVDEEISIIVTNNLIRQANRHFVPIPPHSEQNMWSQCNVISNRYVLTNDGITRLRSTLRSEQKERNEMWLTILAALTGIVGALTGLVSVMNR